MEIQNSPQDIREIVNPTLEQEAELYFARKTGAVVIHLCQADRPTEPSCLAEADVAEVTGIYDGAIVFSQQNFLSGIPSSLERTDLIQDSIKEAETEVRIGKFNDELGLAS